jgi:hypothetical protein
LVDDGQPYRGFTYKVGDKEITDLRDWIEVFHPDCIKEED